jgi:hypothetical protein
LKANLPDFNRSGYLFKNINRLTSDWLKIFAHRYSLASVDFLLISYYDVSLRFKNYI